MKYKFNTTNGGIEKPLSEDEIKDFNRLPSEIRAIISEVELETDRIRSCKFSPFYPKWIRRAVKKFGPQTRLRKKQEIARTLREEGDELDRAGRARRRSEKASAEAWLRSIIYFRDPIGFKD